MACSSCGLQFNGGGSCGGPKMLGGKRRKTRKAPKRKGKKHTRKH